jgi:hypothetical protein
MNSQYPDGPFSRRVDSTIERAKSGDSAAARKILEWFCGAVSAHTKNGKTLMTPSGSGIKIDDRILRYLGERFQIILESAGSADAALGLRRRPHREASPSIVERNRRMALDMGERIENGQTRKEACFAVSESWKSHASLKGRSFLQIQDTVRKAYDKHKHDETFKLKIRLAKKFDETFWKKA